MLSTPYANLLIVETDDLFSRNLSERLRTESYRVFEVRTEAEARKMVRQKNIDVVLVGMKGFKERGLALLKDIKEARPFTEVILLTHSADLSLPFSIEGMKLGAFDDLLVPFDLDTLLHRIRDAHGKKKERERSAKPVVQVNKGARGEPEASGSEEDSRAADRKRPLRRGRGTSRKKGEE